MFTTIDRQLLVNITEITYITYCVIIARSKEYVYKDEKCDAFEFGIWDLGGRRKSETNKVWFDRVGIPKLSLESESICFEIISIQI